MENKNMDTQGLHELYKELSELVGRENMLKLFSHYKGQQLTFPSRLFDKRFVKEKVNREYDGKNVRALARRFDYSERWIRQMVKENKKYKKNSRAEE